MSKILIVEDDNDINARYSKNSFNIKNARNTVSGIKIIRIINQDYR